MILLPDGFLNYYLKKFVFFRSGKMFDLKEASLPRGMLLLL